MDYLSWNPVPSRVSQLDMTRPFIAALAMLSVGLMEVRPAAACLNGVVMELDEAVKAVARAEKDLERGQYTQVLLSLDADHYKVGDPLLRKIETLQAVARLRLGKSRVAERELRRLLRREPDSPYLLTRLAESLAGRSGDDPIEAWRILDQLEAKDLIPDADGYATLARLRARARDREGSKRAVTECLRRARDPRVCPSTAPG
jgi:predicted Zn-dependent protease